MRDAPRIRHGLRTAALILRSRDAILRPDLHRYAHDIVALLAQKVTGDAGIHAAAHPEKDALFFGQVHEAGKVGRPRPPSTLTARLTNGLPRKVNRHGRSAERVMPMRSSAKTSTLSSS